MIGVKICGLSTPETLAAAIGAGASHVGFVSFPKSPRHLAPERLAGLAGYVPPQVARVGVFVDPDDELLGQLARVLDVIQLHGGETPARLADIRARHGRPVWRAAPVAGRADIAAAVAGAGSADLLLFDAKPPRDAPLPGGNGIRIDWPLLNGAVRGRAWGLSGGLTPETVGAAIAASGAPLVDVSSGVEDAPGVKSAAKIRAFVANARAA